MSAHSSSIYSDIPEDSRSPSPALSFASGSSIQTEHSRTPSLYSYSSSRDGAEMLREADGRTFNNQTDVYYLPADEVEFNRLGLQHRIHGFVLGDLYPGAEVIDRILAPEWGVEKAILDVGTGPGHWALAMAKKFPHCHVVGVDLAPRTNIPSIPPNLRLEFDDANLGFPHYHGCFDVIHARSISNGINDYEEFVAELERCLRPGGAMILIDGEPPILDHNGLPLQPAYGDAPYPETKGWMARILHEAGKNMASRGGRVMTNSPYQISRAFIQTGKLYPPVVRTMYIPIGPWPVGSTPEETAWIRQLGEMMRQNALEFIQSLRPILKSQGFSDDTLDLFMYGAGRELRELTVPMYTRWAYGYAVKPLQAS